MVNRCHNDDKISFPRRKSTTSRSVIDATHFDPFRETILAAATGKVLTDGCGVFSAGLRNRIGCDQFRASEVR